MDLYEEIAKTYGYRTKEELQDRSKDLYIFIEHHEKIGNGEPNDVDCWAVKFGDTEDANSIWDRYKKITSHTAYQRTFCIWDSELTDKQIHEVLRVKFKWCGKKDSKDNPFNTDEAYYVESIEDVKAIIKEIEFHVSTHGKYIKQSILDDFKKKNFKEKFTCRSEQEDFVNQFQKYIFAQNRESRRFLLYAVCRFGKTVSTLYAVLKRLGLKKILILSSKCDTEKAWRDDYIKWDFCKEYEFITKHSIMNDPDLLKEDNIICWCSFQSAAKEFEEFDEDGNEISYDDEDETWQHLVAEEDWDIVITDECHFGVDTKRSSTLINKILENTNTILLEISATPFKKINRGDYSIENIYAYTLVDEWKEHHNDPDYVPVHLYHLNLIDDIGFRNKAKKSPLNQKKTNEKIEKCKIDGKFSWRAYFHQFDETDIRTEFELLYETNFKKTGKHCLLYVNRVKDGKKLARAISNGNYDVVNLCGCNTITLDDVNDKLKGKTPVIIISCGKFMTGVTIEQLTNVVFMGKVNSAEMYIQYGLRGKNKYEGRNGLPCAIYDLNTEVYVYSDPFKILVENEARAKGESPKTIILGYEDAFAIFEIKEGKILPQIKNFAQKFTEQFSHVEGDNEAPFCAFEMNEFVMDGLKSLLDSTKSSVGKPAMLITPTQIEKAKAEIEHTGPRKGRKKRTDAEREKMKKLYELRNKFREQVNYLPTFMKFNNVDSIEDLIDGDYDEQLKIWHNINIEIFKTLKTLITDVEWEQFCENIVCVKNKLTSNETEWKYGGLLPAWF